MTIAEKAGHFVHPSSNVTPPLRLGNQTPQKRLKIALLGYRSHPFVGGQGIYLRYLSRALKDLGHNVDVYSGPPYPDLDSDIPLIKVPSLDLYTHPAPWRALTFRNFFSYTDLAEWWSKVSGTFAEPYTFGRRVAKRLKDQSYDIIHDNQSLSYGLLKLQKNNPCVVATIHHPIHQDKKLAVDAESTTLMKWLKKRWYSFLTMQEKVVDQLEYIVTVSKTSQQDISRDFKQPIDKITVIGNGVDTQIFKPLSNIVREPYRVITTASSDQPLKGLRFLLEAVAQVKELYPSITLNIIGKLEPGSQTEQLIQSLGIKDHVEFSHSLTTQQLVEHYARATVAVCPSLYEGFGLPVIEAMACGVPVISSKGGALHEIVKGEGILVDPGNSEQMAQKIKTLLGNVDLQHYFSSRGLKHVKHHYSWTAVAQKLSRYYLDIVRRAHH